MLKSILRKKDQNIVTQRIILILSLIIVMGLFVFSSKGADKKEMNFSKTAALK